MQLHALAPTVGFGTSGVRALVSDLTPTVIRAYTRAFLQHLRQSHQLQGHKCVVGWDLRPSSPTIAASVCAALDQEGVDIDLAGRLPTPALALRAMAQGAPGIMITGSHIPFDRNGIKFYTAKGEILKSDEMAISELDISDLISLQQERTSIPAWMAAVENADTHPNVAANAYLDRYLQLLKPNIFSGLRVGVYQHSAVGRDLLVDLLARLGCQVVPLARSENFVPIDTEAVSAQDEALAAQWCAQEKLHAVVSTDGDGDRPWICDEQGHFVRGDILGILTAKWLGAKVVVTPVSSNTALEKSGLFKRCVRTRIGSPYVIDAMLDLQQQGEDAIAGFEANGGFLLQSKLRGLTPLPTRDSVLPILATLALAQEHQFPLSELTTLLPARFTHADRIRNFATEKSVKLIERLRSDPPALQAFLHFTSSQPMHIDTTDGLRVELANCEILHLRPSGNAPELRCYVEASSPERASSLLAEALQTLGQLS